MSSGADAPGYRRRTPAGSPSVLAASVVPGSFTSVYRAWRMPGVGRYGRKVLLSSIIETGVRVFLIERLRASRGVSPQRRNEVRNKIDVGPFERPLLGSGGPGRYAPMCTS